jgi:hypothetical protein
MNNINGLQQIKDYHVDAAKRLLSYAQDCDKRKSDGDHYRKRAAFHAGLIDILDGFILARTGCPGHGRAECVTCCWPAKVVIEKLSPEAISSLESDRSGQIGWITTENGSTFNWVKGAEPLKGESNGS